MYETKTNIQRNQLPNWMERKMINKMRFSTLELGVSWILRDHWVHWLSAPRVHRQWEESHPFRPFHTRTWFLFFETTITTWFLFPFCCFTFIHIILLLLYYFYCIAINKHYAVVVFFFVYSLHAMLFFHLSCTHAIAFIIIVIITMKMLNKYSCWRESRFFLPHVWCSKRTPIHVRSIHININ